MGQLQQKLSHAQGFSSRPDTHRQSDRASNERVRAQANRRGWALTSGISRRLFTPGTESGWPSPPSCFRLLESWRAVKTQSRGCFSEDLELTEQSRAASSASVSTFTVLFFRTVAEKKQGSAGKTTGCLEVSRVP